jgi:hypothetical protein
MNLTMQTRSRTLKSFHIKCSWCGSRNCCVHKPAQINDNNELIFKTIINKSNECNNAKLRNKRALIINEIFVYLLSNLEFINERSMFREAIINKLEQIKLIEKDLIVIGLEEVNYYIYWCSYNL